jgi:hypothetical protein
MLWRNPEQVSGLTLWASVLLAATLAAVVAWLLGESGLARIKPEQADVMLMGVKLHDVTPETARAAELRSTEIVFAAFGGLLALATGAAGGLVSRSPRKGAAAGLAGLAGGAAVGGLATAVALPLYSRLVADGWSELLTALVAHAGIWVPIGAVAGLALGAGLGGWRRVLRAAAGAAAGALLGAVAFDVLGALAFPLDGTNGPVSTSALSRLAARLFAAIPAAAAALAASGGGRGSTEAQSPCEAGAAEVG